MVHEPFIKAAYEHIMKRSINDDITGRKLFSIRSGKPNVVFLKHYCYCPICDSTRWQSIPASQCCHYAEQGKTADKF